MSNSIANLTLTSASLVQPTNPTNKREWTNYSKIVNSHSCINKMKTPKVSFNNTCYPVHLPKISSKITKTKLKKSKHSH